MPFARNYKIMLFLKDGKDERAPHAVYLFNDDMEEMVRRKVDARLRDHGYAVDDRSEILKDMNFLRSKRLLVEQVTRQIWGLAVRGVMITLGAIIILGMKEYFSL